MQYFQRDSEWAHMSTSLRELASDGFGHWLAGFIDGEGSFSITPNRPGFVCRMTLVLREDDAEIIHEIHRRTGIGKVAQRPPQRGNLHSQVMWRVQTKADCAALIEILDSFPLRAKKARDLEVWARAVRYCASRGEGSWMPVLALKVELAKVRDEHLRHEGMA